MILTHKGFMMLKPFGTAWQVPRKRITLAYFITGLILPFIPAILAPKIYKLLPRWIR